MTRTAQPDLETSERKTVACDCGKLDGRDITDHAITCSYRLTMEREAALHRVDVEMERMVKAVGRPTCNCCAPGALGSTILSSEHQVGCELWREPSVGTKFDSEKDRWDLLPLGFIGDVVKVLTFGARKYAPENWRKVPEWRRRYYAALWRHMAAWWAGEKADPDDGLSHLAHACCCLIFLGELDKANNSQ